MTEAPKSGKALIIEDDREIASIVEINLKDIGIEADLITDGKTGLQRALTGRYSVVILDIMLPQMDGISVCRKIREADAHIPILMLTAKADEIDRVLGLELGADDYMTKPFSVRELNARVKALLRRTTARPENSGHSRNGSVITIGGLGVDFEKRKVTLHGNLIDLTVKEFDLLELFVKNPGRAYSRADLLNLVWGYRFEGYEHTVNTHINRLRGKIEKDPAHPVYIKTVWGVGYRFAEKSEMEI